MSPRMNRSQLSTHTYFHVCARGNGGRKIFEDSKDNKRYLIALEKYRLKFRLEYYAYCLMTNHVHLLLLAPSIMGLSKAIHGIHLTYVMYFNRRYHLKGHLFEDRFSSWVLRDEKHLLETKEYIENNPVNAGLVSSKENYPWSSAGSAESFVTISQINSYEEPSLI